MRKLHLRLLKYKEKEITYFGERQFSSPQYESEVLAIMPGFEKFERERESILTTNIPPELRLLYQYPLLTKEQEYFLFRQFSYCKYKANMLLAQVNFDNVTEAKLRPVDAWVRRASAAKHLAVGCNTRLVGNLAKKQYEYIQNPSLEFLLTIISDGNVGLTRAVDYFDYRMGLKFSTYATWAILDTIKKGREQRNKYSERMLTGYDDVLYKQVDRCREQPIDFSDRDYLAKLVNKLAPRKQEVIERYFGLRGKPAENLEKIGLRLNLSKERVRQIKEESLDDLRLFADAT